MCMYVYILHSWLDFNNYVTIIMVKYPNQQLLPILMLSMYILSIPK